MWRTVAGIRCTVYHCEESTPGSETSESSALTFLAEIMRHPLWSAVRLGDSDEANVRGLQEIEISKIRVEICQRRSFMWQSFRFKHKGDEGHQGKLVPSGHAEER